ncbi:PLDc N-terminal domain-containing protein [Nocardioides sp.]|uniref:PLDc N-terminal domain-containing protein n=1 Tax=Nocardioides sp. TaxID=35761 RepID=UPI0035626B3F
MVKLQLLAGVIYFAVWVFALIDVLGTPETKVRTLPKIGWVLVVAVFGVVGALAWFVMGRPASSGRRARGAYERPATAFPEYDRPGRAAAADPAKDEEFLRQVRERADEQRRRYEQSKRTPEPPATPESPEASQPPETTEPPEATEATEPPAKT